MDNKELAAVKLEAESWLTRSDEDRAYKGTAMPEEQANAMAKTVLKLLEQVKQATEEQCALQEEVSRLFKESRDVNESVKIASAAYGEVVGIRPVLPLLDELFFNTDGDEAFTKFMTAEKAYQKFRGRDE